MTPPSLAKKIVAHFKPYGECLDPCSGEGAFFNELNCSPDVIITHWMEVRRGRNFLTDFVPSVDYIVTNPPWSLFKEFLGRAMEVSDNIVFLVTLNHFQTKARMRMIEGAGFAFREIVLVETPPKPWPQSGFQVAAVHIERGWEGNCKFSKL